jgi:hypothetical protein
MKEMWPAPSNLFWRGLWIQLAAQSALESSMMTLLICLSMAWIKPANEAEMGSFLGRRYDR